jgi:uncharacterized protein (TIGR02466 family)
VERLSLFATEIFVFRPEGVDALNAQALAALLAEREATSGLVRSNVGGWHSIPDLSQRPEAPFRPLMNMLVEHVSFCVRGVAGERGLAVPPHRWSVHAWAMVMQAGDYTILHDHAESHWSLAWYIDAGDPPPEGRPEAGSIAFIDPRRAAAAMPGLDLNPSTFTVRPESGMLVIFPGYLQHYVHPYRGARPRVCVSANLKMEPLPGGPPPA